MDVSGESMKRPIQSVVTRFVGPTDHKGARIRVSCEAKTRFFPFEYGAHDPHAFAAAQHIAALGWGGTWVGGGLPDGKGNAFVCVSKEPRNHTVVDGVRCDHVKGNHPVEG